MDHKVTFGGKPVTLVGNRCKVGETAPVFTVTDAGLQPVSSDVFHGKVRIYSVFPSVDTPVCSLQNIRFNREASKLGDDVVRYVEYVPEVTHEPDYEKALAVARELAK